MTVAISLLIHGEAVRFNRGQSRGDDYDFKYMRGRDGREYPYVSSQCYKKYWRESLAGPFSPITREKDAAGKEKNQAFTSGNPMDYPDDDLFGYMIAGATDAADESVDTLDEAESGAPLFEAGNIKDAQAMKGKLLDANPLSRFIIDRSAGAKEALENSDLPSERVQSVVLEALNKAVTDDALSKEKRFEGIKGTAPLLKKLEKTKDRQEIGQLHRSLLLKAFPKELQERPKRPTTRRTAPVRMHALVAFSGIKTAKDFQTFSRDIAYTGKNSIVNPAVQGIYSGWLKTRILIESHRIGKFYIGENMDILKDHVAGYRILSEPNPYSRERESVEYLQLDDTERTNRLRAALRALADIGNRQGPASGALHDGSLRPKAFVAGMMNCADSPFDYIWVGRNDESLPEIDVNLLRDTIKDWEDLFATRKIYVGLPGVGSGAAMAAEGSGTVVSESSASEIKETIKAELKRVGFEAIVDTPRKALLRLSEEAAL
ncbi:MAG: hypothetical protein JO033_28535 [Acidobacteriaceae bacterium]|nr:hypothetical protein [Acidobacteriaceae bacterium]